MARIVQKYGGTSVATAGKITEVARQVRATREAGHDVVVVVSAMGGATDELLALASSVSERPDLRELDALLCTGEAKSAALLSLALNQQGVTSRSFGGPEAGIRTDQRHGDASIEKIEPGQLRSALASGVVPVVAGFQGEAGVGGARTTLGRGGSDTTGVALAAAIAADHCEIVTDVSGVYTADPRQVTGARRHTALSYEEMAELAASGAKVLAPSSVEYARTHGVDLKVRSYESVSDPGTWVGNHRPCNVRDTDDSWIAAPTGRPITGVASQHGLVRCVLRRISADSARRAFAALAEHRIEMDLCRYGNLGTEGVSDVAFTLSAADSEEARSLLTGVALRGTLDELHWTSNLARLSVVGMGLGREADSVPAMLQALRSVDALGTDLVVAPHALRVLIRESSLSDVAQSVHDAFVDGPSAPRLYPVSNRELPAQRSGEHRRRAIGEPRRSSDVPALTAVH
ncbi:aspartate kinase [Streptomyces sp. RGM 3693]|uniref:aspartate kinase n=1 Tax=Streptomyces sp. RGM 3693 TaxID=3413284 RepID=UPI003D278850